MRPIKFRAWNPVQQVMYPCGSAYYCEGGILAENESSNSDGEILMQFTGLKDKNGKEIYEGDIVNWKQAGGGLLEPDASTYTCEIKWERTGWACVDVKPIKDDYHSHFTFSASHIEVIGNIYENPELLKV